jgi:hypothetical protein
MFKKGDRVKVNLCKEIKKAKKRKNYIHSGVLKFWEEVNSSFGFVTKVISDDEIYIKMMDEYGLERVFSKDTLLLDLDIKRFPKLNNKDCTHTIGLYKSGRCRACGVKVRKNIKNIANSLKIMGVLKKYCNYVKR